MIGSHGGIEFNIVLDLLMKRLDLTFSTECHSSCNLYKCLFLTVSSDLALAWLY